MAYTTIKRGSRGSDVRDLQSTLNSKGYNLSVDGIYGSKTDAAVRDYQSKNGLSVDGIVGNNTWNSLKSSGASGNASVSPSVAPAASTPSKPDYSSYKYDASTDEAYQKAMAALEQAQKNQPSYSDTYGEQIKAIYDKIMNRDKFSYDLNGDMLYQQMKDQYTNLGQMAMQDSMGQASGLTGGYGSSYAQSVGQQQYDAYLQKLNDNIPELYQMAASRYDQEGQDMLNQYNMASDAQSKEYDRYRDALSDYWTNVNYLTGRADTAYENGSSNWYNSYNLGMQQDQLDSAKRQDAYSNLTSLIGSTGYSPTDAELNAAGMSRSEAEAWRNAYAQQLAAASASSSGGSSSRSSGGSSRKNSSSSSKKSSSNSSGSGHSANYFTIYANAGQLYSRTKASSGSATKVSDYLAKRVNAGDITEEEAKQILRNIDASESNAISK